MLSRYMCVKTLNSEHPSNRPVAAGNVASAGSMAPFGL